MDRLQALIDAKTAHGSAVSGLFEKYGSNRVTASADEWDQVAVASEAERAARRALIPTEQDAINLMHECYVRLKELGWDDAIYCPKDGSEFDAIEAGSTGIHKAHYLGEWPDGLMWVAEADDMWPSRPMLYRKTEAELARWEEIKKRVRDDPPPPPTEDAER